MHTENCVAENECSKICALDFEWKWSVLKWRNHCLSSTLVTWSKPGTLISFSSCSRLVNDVQAFEQRCISVHCGDAVSYIWESRESTEAFFPHNSQFVSVSFKGSTVDALEKTEVAMTVCSFSHNCTSIAVQKKRLTWSIFSSCIGRTTLPFSSCSRENLQLRLGLRDTYLYLNSLCQRRQIMLSCSDQTFFFSSEFWPCELASSNEWTIMQPAVKRAPWSFFLGEDWDMACVGHILGTGWIVESCSKWSILV